LFGRLAFSWLDPLISTTNGPHAPLAAGYEGEEAAGMVELVG
jgi:hypothetical protein